MERKIEGRMLRGKMGAYGGGTGADEDCESGWSH